MRALPVSDFSPAEWLEFYERGWPHFKACGPGDCVADFLLAGLINPAARSYKALEFEKSRKAFVHVIGKYFLEGKGTAEDSRRCSCGGGGCEQS